jgi:hypothetical protein
MLQQTHVKTVRTTWNLHGNRIKEFSENWLEKGVEFREDQVEVWNRWLKYSNLRNYPAKDKKKFHVIFDEIIGNSPSKTRLGSGEDSRQVWAYSGFRLKRDEEIEKEETLHLNDGKDNSSFGASQSQSSRSSILSLLSINENNNYSKIINSKITELLELIDKSNKSDQRYTFKDDGD